MSPGRVAFGALGGLVMAYGAWLLLTRQDGERLWSAAVWLVGGVLVHDLVLAPVALLLVLATRFLPAPSRTPAVVGLVVLGTTTIWAVPVLGRFGEVPTDPTHLDRDYWLGWGLIAAAVLLGVVAASILRSRRSRATPTQS